MTEFWTDPASAQGWAQHDAQRSLLSLPRAIAAEIIAIDTPEPRLIADVGSGPGEFLAVMLERFPHAQGLWYDFSEPMKQLAQDRLEPYLGRVEFRLGNMTDLSVLPPDLDVIVTSRAVHHLDRAGLVTFYRDAAMHLAPGGWLINLDHFLPTDVWNARLREARRRLIPATTGQKKHRHTHPLPSIADHLNALAAAGLAETDMPWRAFTTALLAAHHTSTEDAGA